MKKKKILILIVITFIVIISQIIINKISQNNKILLNSYIKTLDNKDLNLPCNVDNNKIPYFKLNNNLYNSINKEILENSILRACYQNGYVDYDISLNNNILSLVLYLSYESEDELANIECKTYNINIDNNTKITNQELLNLYKINTNNINQKVLNKFQEYYLYEKQNNLIDQNTTFSNYLSLLNYKSITTNNINLFIDKKNNLYLYLDYNLTEGMQISEYFPNLVNTIKLT